MLCRAHLYALQSEHAAQRAAWVDMRCAAEDWRKRKEAELVLQPQTSYTDYLQT